MQILCKNDYWELHKWEIYELIDWYLCNTFSKESIWEQECFRKYPEYFIEILPEIDVGKSLIEVKVSALSRRHTKLLKDKWYVEKEIDSILEMIYELEKLWADHF